MPTWLLTAFGFFRSKENLPYHIAIGVISVLTYVIVLLLKQPLLTMEAVLLFGIFAVVLLGLAITYFIRANFKEQRAEQAVQVYVQFGDEEPILISKEHPMSFRLSANDAVELTGFTGKNRLGANVPIENPKLTAADPSMLEVVTTPSGRTFIRSLVSEGTVQLQLEADAQPGEGEIPINGTFNVDIWPGVAVAIAPVFGDPIPADQVPQD